MRIRRRMRLCRHGVAMTMTLMLATGSVPSSQAAFVAHQRASTTIRRRAGSGLSSPRRMSLLDDAASIASGVQDSLSQAQQKFTEDAASAFLWQLEELDLEEDTLWEAIATKVQQVMPSLPPDLNDGWNTANAGLNVAVEYVLEKFPALQPLYDQLEATAQQVLPEHVSVSMSPQVALIVSTVVSFSFLSTVLNWGKPPPPSEPYPLEVYDPISARAYFDAHPLQVISRTAFIVTRSLGFGLALLQDFLSKKLPENADQRALQLAQLLTTLGPSFIKIGQSLSIRTDLLSPAYARGLKTLQDQVPAFSSLKAREMLEQELGRPLQELFSELSKEPVAAASLGQVYRARLVSSSSSGEKEQEVAIKVQRPDIMRQIALDMHLIREVAPIVKRAFNLNTDLAGVVDSWGKGFVDELDYLQEAENAEYFTESIQTTTLNDVVFAPPVVKELTTGKILTTEWVEGERLDKSSQDDVTILCSICMNTYLTMMLETGVLHCDPHPGNLFRTTDGRLCILDWGMVTRLDPDLQITLIEHMAHLTSGDYAEVPRDLLLLGFIPQSKADLIKDSGVVEVLADIYGSWTKGGGAANINVNKVIAQLQDLQATRGSLFQIPPYFAYIAKSFSVLEGIGIQNDPNYSIINECLPYVSKRLLTDRSERTGGALSTFIFGADKRNTETRMVDYDRVEQLVTGFGSYTTSASGELLGKESSDRTQLLQGAADQILELLVTDEETPLQKIVIEQLAKIISANSRFVWTEVRRRSGTLPSGRTVLGTMVDPLGLWRTSPIVRMSALDEKTVETTRKLVQLMQTQLETTKQVNPAFDLSTLSNEEALALSSLLTRKLWERRSGVLKTSSRLFTQLLQLTAVKLERGERDFVALRNNSNNDGRIHSSPDVIPPQEIEQKRSEPSSRLLGARRILQELASEDEPVVPAVVPAKFDQ